MAAVLGTPTITAFWTGSSGGPYDLTWADSLALLVAAGFGPQSPSKINAATTPDATNWTDRVTYSGTGEPTNNGVAWSPSLGTLAVVSAGADGGKQIRTSTNASSWTNRSSPFNDLACVCWSPDLSLFCAGGSTDFLGTVNIATSPTGVTWTGHGRPLGADAGSNVINGVCWSPALGLFCAVGTRGDGTVQVATSPDGTTWTTQGAPFGANVVAHSVCWSPERGLFVAVGEGPDTSATVITSPNGSSWTAQGNPFAAGSDDGNGVGLDVIWVPDAGPSGVFVACGWNFSAFPTSQVLAFSSPDGATWTAESLDPVGAGITGNAAQAVGWSPTLEKVLIGGAEFMAVYDISGPPPPDPSAAQGIRIAFGQDAFETNPVWTRIDYPLVSGLQAIDVSPFDGRFVAAFRTDRGRAYELDKTQAGTAQLTCYDVTGFFDPTNPASPFYGQITPNMRASINVQNPSSLAYHDIFTGFVESFRWTMDTAEKMMTLRIDLVDGFEILTRGEIQPDATGTTVYAGTSDVKTRIDALLDDAGWPTPAPTWRRVNTGNVYLQRTVYNVQTSFLSAIQDAADAEFPGVANFFMDKAGAATFYGRYPRFQPTNYPQDVTFWQAGDESAADTFGCARIADIEWALDSKNLINASSAWPFGITQADLLGQLVVDPGSITQFGVRTLSLPDLIIDGQPAGGGISPQPAADANTAAKYYAQYYVQNYAQPQLRISRLLFKTRARGDSETWALIMGVEIGDIITVFTRNPGGGGFSKQTDSMTLSQFFVEGIHNDVKPLEGNLWDWTMSLDVSPRGWFTYAPWGS